MENKNECHYGLQARYDVSKVYSVITSRANEAGETYQKRTFLILDFAKCPNPGFGICDDCERNEVKV